MGFLGSILFREGFSMKALDAVVSTLSSPERPLHLPSKIQVVLGMSSQKPPCVQKCCKEPSSSGSAKHRPHLPPLPSGAPDARKARYSTLKGSIGAI